MPSKYCKPYHVGKRMRYKSEFSFNFHYFWFSVFWMLHNREWHNTRQKFRAMERDWQTKLWLT